MSLNIDNLMEALGRIGRNAYLIDTAQAAQGTPFSELAGYAYLNPEWLSSLGLAYDGALRAESGGMAAWQQTAATILQNLVGAVDNFYGRSIGASLTYLYNAMVAQGKTVGECTIGESVTPYSGNVGTGTVFVTLQRGDGLILQNTVAETTTVLITADSYTGGATVGREPWTWTGAQNLSSYGTGAAVNLWDFDWPQGSAASVSGNCISSAQDATASGNYLTNGDWEDTVGSPAVPNNWHLNTGVWGTDIQITTGGIDGGNCVQFNVGATLNNLSQQFNSSISDGTNAAAGTTANPASPASNLPVSFAASLWLKAAGVISGGVMKVELTDGSGTVVNDQAGTPNSTTINLTGASTSWTNYLASFRLPTEPPAVLQLRIRISTALAGAALLMDANCFAGVVNCYAGGPSIQLFSNPAAPFVARPNQDGFQVAFTNNRNGASYGATLQMLLNRLFQTATFIAPYSGTPSYADTLITNP